MVRSLIFIVLGLMASPQLAQAKSAEDFAKKYLGPLIGARQKFFKINYDEGEDPKRIRLTSSSNGVVLGRYEIILNPQSSELPKQAPLLNLNSTRINHVDVAQIQATLELPLEPAEDPTPLLRSLLRSDFLLHPMQTPPGAPAQPTRLQYDIIEKIENYISDAEEKGEIARSIVILPPGFGKTLIAGTLLKREFVDYKQPYKIIFVVQNKEILDEATSKLQNLLGLSPAQVVRAYGEGSRQEVVGRPVQLISITRTTLMRNIHDLMAERATFKGRFAFVFDEVHHTGKVDGEYGQIISQLNSGLKPADLILGLSATPWHADSDLIERLFHNHVATALLSDAEQQKFLHERRLIYMSRLMLFRAMAEGYLSPIRSYRQVRYLEQEGKLPILARQFLNDWSRRYEGLSEAERLEQLRKDVLIHVPLVMQMLKEIKGTFRVGSDGKLITPNRGIIFVPSIAHANVYAFLLNQRASKGEGGVYAKAYHSDLSDDERSKTLDWFRDQEVRSVAGAGRVHRLETKTEVVHKYLFAVRALGEGVDEPRVNHIILARPYSEVDQIGMKDLIQNLGRGSRLAYPKPDFTVSDFTGDMLRLIFEGMDQSLVDRFFVTGGERDFAPPAAVEEPAQVLPKPEAERGVVLDHATLDPEQFQTESIVIPERHFSATPPGQSGSSATREPIPPSVFGASYRPTAESTLNWLQFFASDASIAMFLKENPQLDLDGNDQNAHWASGRRMNSLIEVRRRFNKNKDLVHAVHHLGLAARDLARLENDVEPPTPATPKNRPARWMKILSETQVPWTDKELEDAKSVGQVSGKPTLFQALLRLRFDTASIRCFDELTWADIFETPAGVYWALRQFGVHNFDGDFRQVDFAEIVRESHPYYSGVPFKPILEKLSAQGFRTDVPMTISTGIPALELLTLPESYVWTRTLPADEAQKVVFSSVTVAERLVRLFDENKMLELSDYLNRVQIALQINFQERQSPANIVRTVREWLAGPRHSVIEAFAEENRTRTSELLQLATWGEVFESSHFLWKLIDGSDLRILARNAIFNDRKVLNLKQFLERSDAEWLHTPNFGRLSLVSVRELIAEYGLGQSGSVPERVKRRYSEASPFFKGELTAELDNASAYLQRVLRAKVGKRKSSIFDAFAVFREDSAFESSVAAARAEGDPGARSVTWREVFSAPEVLNEMARPFGADLHTAEVADKRSVMALWDWHPANPSGREKRLIRDLNERILVFFGLGQVGAMPTLFEAILDWPSPFIAAQLTPGLSPLSVGKHKPNLKTEIEKLRLNAMDYSDVPRSTWREVLSDWETVNEFMRPLTRRVRAPLEEELRDPSTGRFTLLDVIKKTDLELMGMERLGRKSIVALDSRLRLFGLGRVGEINPQLAKQLDELSPISLDPRFRNSSPDLLTALKPFRCEELLGGRAEVRFSTRHGVDRID